MVRLRWVLVGGWLLGGLAVAITLPGLDEAGGGGQFGGLTTADNPALRTEIRSFERFGFPVLTRTAVVQRDPAGLSSATQIGAIAAALEFNVAKPPDLRRIEFALPVTNSFRVVPGSREDGTTLVTYLYFRPDVSFRTQTRVAAAYAQRYLSDPEDHLVGVSGVIPARVAQLEAIRGRLGVVERATVVLIILVVALNFRALGAALVTVTTAGLALVVILHVAGWAGQQFGLEIPSEIEPVLVALLLGIVTDYSIFFLAGTRERLLAGDHRVEAARHSAAEFGPIVFVAGLTVAGGSLALLVAQVGAFRAFGPGMALTILLSLAVAVTFVPACLAILGRAVFWPSLRHRPAPARRRKAEAMQWAGRRLMDVVVRRRGAAVVVTVASIGLLLAAAPLRNLDLGFAVIESLPDEAEPARAADAAARGFLPGILSPIVLLVEQPGITERRAALVRLEELIEDQPGVAGVAGPREQPSPRSLGAVLSTSGDAARYVLLSGTDPLGSEAIDNLRRLRAAMPRLLAEAGVPEAAAAFAGDTALADAVVSQTEDDLVLVILLACGFGFLLLALFLRALIAPLYLMAANGLAVAASLGLTTLVFQQGPDGSGLTFYVPFAATVLLVALASDYTIFGVGYIWAEARSQPLVAAIRVAVPRSTRAITAAGITLAMSFAILAIVPLRPFREFAFVMSAGILLDVFVVRSLLIPALIRLVGPASGWPGGALRYQGDREPARTPASARVTTGAGAPPVPVSARAPAPRVQLLLGVARVVAGWAAPHLHRTVRHRKRRTSRRS
ncbi:MAG TPA: MMPL family transporter [Acidimicrobiales bacterium]|nr:MMPL family transporter [Acidimicrobiales bacterium]